MLYHLIPEPRVWESPKSYTERTGVTLTRSSWKQLLEFAVYKANLYRLSDEDEAGFEQAMYPGQDI